MRKDGAKSVRPASLPHSQEPGILPGASVRDPAEVRGLALLQRGTVGGGVAVYRPVRWPGTPTAPQAGQVQSVASLEG